MPKILGVHTILPVTVVDDLYISGFTNFSGGGMKLTNIIRNTNNAIKIDNTGAFTKIVANRTVVGVSVSFNVQRGSVSNGINTMTRYNSSNVSQESFQCPQSGASSAIGAHVLSLVIDMNAGDYLQFTDQNNTSVTGASLSASCTSVV